MQCLVVTCVFPPEPVVSARTSMNIVEALRRHGHEVDVITSFPNRPEGVLYKGYRRRLFSRERLSNGVVVTRCFGLFSRTSGMISRLSESLSFGLTSALAIFRTPRPDVAYVNTWPLIGAGLAVGALRLRRVPVVLSVQDVYPESLVSQRRIAGDGFAARCLRNLDGWIARRCRALILISSRFREIYGRSRRVPEGRMHVVPNWIDADGLSFSPDEASRFRERVGIPPDAFVAAYGGNVGLAAGVETLIRAAALVRDKKEVFFLVAGAGSELERCLALAKSLGLDRIVFYSPWPEGETGSVLGAADVLVLPTRGEQSEVSVPSKLIAYLLAGKPVIALARPGSDTAGWIDEAKAGWVIDPDDPEALASMIRRACELPLEDRRRLGAGGRALALREMTTESCLPRVVDILEQSARSDAQ
jgi:colanic acid biosynthesis glycosyl transferase WcaI